MGARNLGIEILTIKMLPSKEKNSLVLVIVAKPGTIHESEVPISHREKAKFPISNLRSA